MTNQNKNKNSEGITLSADERADLKRSFMAFMNANPQNPPAPVRSPYFHTLFHAPFAYAALLLVVMGGTVYAADGSLPSDTLYAIKTEIMEPLEVQVALTDSQKARVYGSLVVRRLEEAESLARQDRLSDKLASVLEQKIEEHADAAHDILLEADQPDEFGDALEVGTDIETALDAHGQILAELIEDDLERNETLADFIAAIENQSEETESIGDDLEDALADSSGIEVDAYVERTRQEAERAIEMLAVALETTASDDVDFLEEIQVLLDGARESHAFGERFLSDQNTEGALTQFRASLQDAEQGAIMEASLQESP